MLKCIVLLSVMVAIIQAFVCPKNFCDKVECKNLSDCLESNGQKIREKGSFCRCCDICVTVLGENEACFPEIGFGIIRTSECAEGLYCHPKRRVCAKHP